MGQDATIIGRPQSNNDDECVELSSLATSHSHSTIPNAPPTNVTNVFPANGEGIGIGIGTIPSC